MYTQNSVVWICTKFSQLEEDFWMVTGSKRLPSRIDGTDTLDKSAIHAQRLHVSEDHTKYCTFRLVFNLKKYELFQKLIGLGSAPKCTLN